MTPAAGSSIANSRIDPRVLYRDHRRRKGQGIEWNASRRTVVSVAARTAAWQRVRRHLIPVKSVRVEQIDDVPDRLVNDSLILAIRTFTERG